MPTWNKEQNPIKIHHRGKFKTEDETLLRTNLGGKSSLVPCFLHVYCLHPDFSLHPQFHSVPSVRMTLHNTQLCRSRSSSGFPASIRRSCEA
jgi:hypothetical protein